MRGSDALPVKTENEILALRLWKMENFADNGDSKYWFLEWTLFQLGSKGHEISLLCLLLLFVCGVEQEVFTSTRRHNLVEI